MTIQFQSLLSALERLHNLMNQHDPDRQLSDNDQVRNCATGCSSNLDYDAEMLCAAFENDLESVGWVWLLRDALNGF